MRVTSYIVRVIEHKIQIVLNNNTRARDFDISAQNAPRTDARPRKGRARQKNGCRKGNREHRSVMRFYLGGGRVSAQKLRAHADAAMLPGMGIRAIITKLWSST